MPLSSLALSMLEDEPQLQQPPQQRPPALLTQQQLRQQRQEQERQEQAQRQQQPNQQDQQQPLTATTPPSADEQQQKLLRQKRRKRKQSNTWSSRVAFYFAAVGSAVGFGNVWRFPALAVQYGGGAFLIPYLLALTCIGMPIMALEFGLSQYLQASDVSYNAFLHVRWAGKGLASMSCAYILCVYYCMLIAWVTRCFFQACTETEPIWIQPNVTGADAVGYFFNNIVGMSTMGPDMRATRIVWENVAAYAFVCVVMFFLLAFGLRWTGRFSYFTMSLPFVCLFLFMGRAVTLPGSSNGITAFIGNWDFAVLTESPAVWSLATTQVFFSLSLTFGCMSAYGAHCDRQEPAYVNAAVVCCSDTMFSIIASFAVFATMGHLAYQQGKSLEEMSFGGFSLVFGTWPVVLGQSSSGGIHWVRLLFLDLFCLGIDSAISMLEAFLTVIQDMEMFQDTPKWKLVGFSVLMAFGFSFMYATDAGLFWLDVIDYYINFILIAVGFLETFGAGWMYGLEDQIRTVGAKAVYSWMFLANFFPVLFGCSLWFGIQNENRFWAGFVGMFSTMFLGVLTTAYFLNERMHLQPYQWSWGQLWWEVSFSNIVRLKTILEQTIQPYPTIWPYLIKGVIPHLLIVLFINGAAAKTKEGKSVFGHYEGYPTEPYQVLGILTLVFAVALFAIGLVFPSFYTPLIRHDSNIVQEFRRAEAEMLGKPYMEVPTGGSLHQRRLEKMDSS